MRGLGTGTRRLLAYAWELGYRFQRHSGGGHILLRHALTGEWMALPGRCDEASRDFVNYRSQLTRAAGGGKRGQAAAPGTRRVKRATGEGREVAARKGARIANAREEAARRLVSKRLNELSAVERLMRG